MFAKILGILFLLAGGILALGVLFQLIGTIFGLFWVLVKLAVPIVLVYIGYRLLGRDDGY